MKALVALAAWLAVVGIAAPATAYLAEVTTVVVITDANDDAALRRALESAVEGVLKDAIAFTPTLVVLTRAVLVGDRLYVRLLLADREGERAVKDLSEPPPRERATAELDI